MTLPTYLSYPHVHSLFLTHFCLIHMKHLIGLIWLPHHFWFPLSYFQLHFSTEFKTMVSSLVTPLAVTNLQYIQCTTKKVIHLWPSSWPKLSFSVRMHHRCTLAAKTGYFDKFARPIPKWNHQWQSFTNTVTCEDSNNVGRWILQQDSNPGVFGRKSGLYQYALGVVKHPSHQQN